MAAATAFATRRMSESDLLLAIAPSTVSETDRMLNRWIPDESWANYLM